MQTDAAEVAAPGALALTREELEQSVPARFEQVVRRVPDRVALVGNGRSWTYAALNAEVNRTADAIRASAREGIGCVALLTDHSPEMVVAVLAALKAGKIYLTLHHGMPEAAQREIVRDAAPDLLLTTSAFASRAREIALDSRPVLTLDSIDESRSPENPPLSTTPSDPSTIFYTSGSTGRPKGVVKSHRAVLHRAWLARAYDSIVPADRVSLLTSCSFASSEADLFGSLLNGATLCVFDVATQGLAAFREWIDAERITLLHPPALLFRRFLAALQGEDLFPSVRLVTLAGDVVLPADVQRWQRHFSPRCELRHRFSTTETALVAVACIGRDADVSCDVLAAGRPVTDKTLLLVDDKGQPVPAGQTGEVIVKSRYLADGYWRRPDETAAAFRHDPDVPGQRIYRTGDLGRFTIDGDFVFLGRRDHQTKIRGYRVEVREVEEALLQLDDVAEAAVIVHDAEDEAQLVAFLAMRPSLPFDAADVRWRLQQRLPEWKIPARLHAVSSLPTTLNGKVDRKRLEQELGNSSASSVEALPARQRSFAAPRSRRERQLAAIWGEVLQLPSVGVDDDFFELGGHSLRAIQLFENIERMCGCKLPIASLYQHGTIRGMAALLDKTTAKYELASVVTLQPNGKGRPLFVLPSIGGELLYARPLIEQLGLDHPVYGLQPALSASAIEEFRDFKASAGRLASALRAFQPHGPYALAGYSYGGLMAYEAACQLAELGEQVDLLAILDVGPGDRGRQRERGDLLRWLGAAAVNLPYWLREELRHFSAARLGGAAARKLRRTLRRLGRSVLGEGHEPRASLMQDYFDLARIPTQNRELMQAVFAASRAYLPGRYAGRLTLIRSSTRPLSGPFDADLGWGRFVDDVDVYRVPGHHESILHPPDVGAVADNLRRLLDSLDARRRAGI